MDPRRINRFLSEAGLGSRRAVERLIRDGRVSLNGSIVRDLSTRVDPVSDRVEVDGVEVRARPGGRVFLLHKPRGVISSFRRQGDAPCLADVLPPDLLRGRLFHVGRLDRDSSGLLLLSDDGDLANALLHPGRPVWKRYLVTVDRSLGPEELESFAEGGITLDGRPCAPARIDPLEGPPAPRYRIELREGRKRQIRRMMEALGVRVLELHRTAFGGIELGSLARGELRALSAPEIARLRAAAGVDVD